MPSNNKRVNLTISDQVYERIQAYKLKNGISSDATACMQLIVRQLDGIENAEKMMQMMSRFTLEEVQKMSELGLKSIQVMSELNKPNEE